MATSEEIKQQAKEARMAISRQVASAGSNATNALLSQAVKALWEIALQLAEMNEREQWRLDRHRQGDLGV